MSPHAAQIPAMGAAPNSSLVMVSDGKAVDPLDDTVCIVDDDPFVCDSLSALLEAHGFTVATYTAGAALLADERRRHFGCLIVDQHMPGMDGLGILAALRREAIAVPSILVTGRLDPSIADRAERLGAIGVLEKPFPVARLIELVRAGLDDAG